MPQIRHDIQQLAALGDIYAERRAGSVGLPQQCGDHGAHASTRSRRIWTRRCWRRPGSATPAQTSFDRGGPYLARGAADLVPTAQLLDTYSPELFCTVRNYHDVEPKVSPRSWAATATR